MKSNLGLYEAVIANQLALKICMKHHLNPEKYGISKEKYESMGYTDEDFKEANK